MKRFYFYFILLCFLLTSCNKNEKKPEYEGEVILTSEVVKQGDTYNTLGFSFEKGTNIPYPYTSEGVPDLVVTHFISTDLYLIVTFTSPNNQEAFHLYQISTSADQAKSYFDNYLEVTTTSFGPLADSIKINQVWTVQTVDKKYAKLLIKEIQLMKDSPVDDYVEVKVKYKYQPDGRKIFSND
ncbi:MAG: hypothetical protein AMS27_02935 [Bacteroides sp. SM23_62_1]|nr:MAG: hypothetical protein AMS27_02935 [Bacteroides sp. SM23_62_1]